MVKCKVPSVDVLVTGYSGRGKSNFINRCLHYYRLSAEIRRKSGATYFARISDKNIIIQLHDINNVEKIDRKCYDKMDVVILFYAANDPKTFQSIENWISLMRADVGKELHSSDTRSKKEVHSFVVADLSNLGSQQDVTECLSRKAKNLEERFGITGLVGSSFEDDESFTAFGKILDEVITLKAEISRSLQCRAPETCAERIYSGRFSPELTQYGSKRSKLEFSDFGEIDFEKESDYRAIKETSKLMLDILKHKSRIAEEKTCSRGVHFFENLAT